MLVILQIIITYLTRIIGKILNTIIAWATLLIFGKVSRERQIFLSMIGLASVFWIISVLGILFPRFVTFLFTFIILPKFIHLYWIRLGMFVAAILIPLGVGILSLYLFNPDERPKGFDAKAETLLKGYRFTLGLGITMILMLFLAPIMRLRLFWQRWVSRHLPMIVRKEDYKDVVDDIQKILESIGWHIKSEPANWMVRLPTRIFSFIAEGDKHKLVVDNLITLRADDFEVLLHPSDLVVSGKKEIVDRVQVAISEQMAFSKAYMTWDKQANQIEDKLVALWSTISKSEKFILKEAFDQLHVIEKEINGLKFPYEEWEVLFREKLLVERCLLQMNSGIKNEPRHVSEHCD